MANSGNPAAAPPAQSTVFLRRLISSVILWSVVLTTLCLGNRSVSEYFCLGIMLTLAGLGLAEFYGLVEKRGLVCFKTLGISGGLLLMGCTFFYLSGRWGHVALPSKANDFETSFLIIFVLGLCLRQLLPQRNPAGLLAISTTLLGLMYVPWLLNFIQKINFFPKANGPLYIGYFLVVTKFSDIGAYVTGSLIGKHKLSLRISPGKTWEGLIGAVLISTSASLAFAFFAGSRLEGMNLRHAAILGLILSLTAVVGDLIESLFKREVGVKDSGHFFPGIGGILDLLDSILFNAPLMYLYLRHVLTHGL